MAQKISTILVDDITGKEIAEGEGETISFAVNGAAFEIDLDSKGAAKFHDMLNKYINYGRKAGKAGASGSPRRRKVVDVDPSAVRAWAASNKIDVSPRGRIAVHVVEQFKAAGN